MSTEDYLEREDETGEHVINPVGVGIAALGGAIMAFASFLPLDEPNGSFARVQANTLVQHGGWWLTAAGAVIIASVLTSYASKQRKRTIFLLILLAGLIVVHFATDKSLRTVYPVEVNGELDQSVTGTLVPLGISIYVAGVGVLLALVGGLIMQSTGRHDSSRNVATKQCPDCAEIVLAEARVCKHCGYRFDSAGLVATNDH